MSLGALSHQQSCTLGDFSRETLSVKLRETVLVVLKH